MSTEAKLKKTFSIRKLLREAWTITKNNLGKILLLEILAFVVLTAAGLLINRVIPVHKFSPWYQLFSNQILRVVFNIYITLGLVNVFVKFSKFERVKIVDLFNQYNRIITYILACIIVGLVIFFCMIPFGFVFYIAEMMKALNGYVFFGLLLTCIPVIFLAIRFSLSAFFIVDQKAKAAESLDKSWESVKGASWKVLAFYLVCFFFCLFIGILFGGPLVYLFAATLSFKVAIIIPLILGLILVALISTAIFYLSLALLYRTLWKQTNVTFLVDELDQPPTESPSA